MRTSVSPDGTFHYGIHKPSYSVRNLRNRTRLDILGRDQHNAVIKNSLNYPDNDIEVPEADWIYEVANPFPFRGTTFIGKSWADKSADHYERIRIPAPKEVSLSKLLSSHEIKPELIDSLPNPLLLSLATTSTDPEDLTLLARLSCTFETDANGQPTGLLYTTGKDGHINSNISNHALFEAVANNPALPDPYKIAMVIRPGAQGASEIVGDFHHTNGSHIYEYLRRNSYIGGGHYASNMADDAIRYSIDSLSRTDMQGLRHLYYQRTYTRLADLLGIKFDCESMSPRDLETLRGHILHHPDINEIALSATLWGWNFGFDYASSGYRLHASHQQIHQQYAMIADTIKTYQDGFSPSIGTQEPFVCGDMISEIIKTYREQYHKDFFTDYQNAIDTNKRMDGRNDREKSLVIWQDDNVILFVPKAQTSQWELQLMTKQSPDGHYAGNILEADSSTRESLDSALLKAQQALAGRGAQMVTSIEYSKKFTSQETGQPLIYCLMPKLPESPGAFSETQLRFINGHYPEDFAAVCRQSLAELEK